MSKIAVDVTPLLPGGINGGAKPMVLALLKHLPVLMQDCEFVLLTSSSTHDELAFLDRPNFSRLCVRQPESPKNVYKPPTQSWFYGLPYRAYNKIRQYLPWRIISFLKSLVYGRIQSAGYLSSSLLSQLNADLLFCPFTAPTYWEPQIPILSILYDLQFKVYPHFFAPDELFHREKYFQDTIRKASHIVTISDYVRTTVLEYSNIPGSQITTIHISHVQDFVSEEQSEGDEFLKNLGIEQGHYLFYPANFWQHKNHAMLFTAFRLYLEKHPETRIKLVCTGAIDNHREEFANAVRLMGMEEHVVLPGFLPSNEVGILFQHALALIFPSLYEGFGIPLLEAFKAEIPVLCSNVTSLPEVGGEATLYFDPFKPNDIVDAIEKVATNPSLRQELVEKGRQRLAYFGSAERMSREYVALLRDTLERQPNHTQFQFVGVTDDGWFQEHAGFIKPHTGGQAELEIRLNIPSWIYHTISVVAHWERREIADWKLNRRGEHTLNLSLPPESGRISLTFAPRFLAANFLGGADTRLLSVQCIACQVKEEETITVLYPLQETGKA